MRAYTSAILFSFVLLTTLFTGCGDPRKQALTQKWKVQDLQFEFVGQPADNIGTQMFRQILAGLRKHMVEHGNFEFLPGGKLILQTVETPHEGTWELQDESLIVMEGDSVKTIYEIRELTEKKLVIVFREKRNDQEIVYIYSLVPGSNKPGSSIMPPAEAPTDELPAAQPDTTQDKPESALIPRIAPLATN
jgi:hypothetical protein